MILDLQFFGGRGAYSSAMRLAQILTESGHGNSIPIVISRINDKTLQGIENRIRNLKHEEAFAFNSDGKLVDGVSGGTSKVEMPDRWKDIEGATVTHGHPYNRYGYGGTLSVDDAETFLDSKWKELRAAAHGKGEFNYIVRRTSKSDDVKLKKFLIKDRERLRRDIATTYRKVYNESRAKGKNKQSALQEAGQKAAG